MLLKRFIGKCTIHSFVHQLHQPVAGPVQNVWYVASRQAQGNELIFAALFHAVYNEFHAIVLAPVVYHVSIVVQHAGLKRKNCISVLFFLRHGTCRQAREQTER